MSTFLDVDTIIAESTPQRQMSSKDRLLSVAIRELKASLSRVLSRAQGGEVIEVTSHNKPIARIVGIPPQAEEGLRRLIAGGGLSWSGGKPRLKAPLKMVARGTPVSRMVLEDTR